VERRYHHRIYATIRVEREGQKAMSSERGAMLKKIGTLARRR